MLTIRIIPYQQYLSPALPKIIGNADYHFYIELLDNIDTILNSSGLEESAIRFVVEQEYYRLNNIALQLGVNFKGLNEKHQIRIQWNAIHALRCTIVKFLLQLPYRQLAKRLAESGVLQKFCKLDRLDIIRIPSKSQLERYEKIFPTTFINELHQLLIKKLAGQTESPSLLAVPVELSSLFIDLTCIKGNIHFPADWVLLRDATRTLMKAVTIIRKQGLVNRMNAPEEFIREMNKLCIQMSQKKYKKGAAKHQKKIFRLMKKLMKKIENHAKEHLALLLKRWKETDLTEKQMRQIAKRMEEVLLQLPEAIRQAHERIIGGRIVKTEEKILSLYDGNLNVIVRNKSGARVEFGNSLLLCEQKDGLILDWKLYKDGSPADCKTIIPCLEKIESTYGEGIIDSVTGDRGCWAEDVTNYLQNKGIKNYICPRSVRALEKKVVDEEFMSAQRRRGQTEGRIGILKNVFIGKPLRSKKFTNRERSVAFAVLTHNLWVVGRLMLKQQAEEKIA
jgi:hypothetical protein